MNQILEKKLRSYQPQMLESISRLVKIRSVEVPGEGGTPFGTGVQHCLEETLELSRELGFSAVNMDNMIGWAEAGAGKEMVAILGHLDVVPEGSGWHYPPYETTLVGDRLYGRGTIDDKGPVIAALYALKAIKELNIPLRRRVRVLFGLNEETQDLDVKYYLAHGGEVPVMGFTPDGEYPLINGEKGILNETYSRTLKQEGEWRLLRIKGGGAANVVPDAAFAELLCPEGFVFPGQEKISIEAVGTKVKICAAGLSAHGSHPELGENAIGRLAGYLAGLPLTGDSAEAVKFLSEKIGMDPFGEKIGCALRDDVSGPLSFNLGVIDGDENSISVRLNYRYPVTFTDQDCQPAVQRAFEEAGWKLTSHVHKAKLYMPESAPLVQTLLGVYRAETGDNSPALCIGGGTYAKCLPNILAFGAMFPGDVQTEHQPDEYLSITRLMQNTRIIAQAILALAGEETVR